MRLIKWIVLLLVVVLLAGQMGCGLLGEKSVNPSDREALTQILDDLAANLWVGTAGSSLTSARLAAELAAWAETANVDNEQAIAIVGQWLKEQTPEIQADFREKMDSVSASFQEIARDGAADLLDAAGINRDFSNLGTRLVELVQAVLASGGID